MSTQCHHISPQCPVSDTLYRYIPDLGGNAFFTAVFGVLLVAQLGIGIWRRTWNFMIAVALGCFGEFLGYIGRLMMHANVWSTPGLEIQLCCLVIAPSFLAAGVYLVLKDVVNQCGPEYSRLPPKKYPWIFVGCDIGSIVIQAIGGGIAATAGAGSSSALLNAGGDLIMAGIAFQIFTMAVFCGLVVDYYVRRKKGTQRTRGLGGSDDFSTPDETKQPSGRTDTNRRFKLFCLGITLAYVAILIRCIYR